MSASTERERRLARLQSERYDVLVVGAGINGAASAAALATAGARVALIDARDYAGNTSSNSSNLVWGGIKYLENHEYRLVARLCAARNRLMRARPTSVKEIRFLVSIRRGFRYPAILVYLGAVFYWCIGRFQTRGPRYLSKRRIEKIEPAVDTTDVKAGLEYSDGYLPEGDARLVLSFVHAARDAGATVCNYLRADDAARTDDDWSVSVEDQVAGARFRVQADILINACGPEVDAFNAVAGQTTRWRHVYSKGIHLVVDRVTPDERILTFFASDGRMFFITPSGSRSVIGTTDTRVTQPVAGVTEADRRFVLDNVNRMLTPHQRIDEASVVAERVGVRPLAVQGQTTSVQNFLQLSRKHVLEVDTERKHLSIFGGKLTDCVVVGEQVVHAVRGLGVRAGAGSNRWYAEPGREDRHAYLARCNENDVAGLTDPRAREPLPGRLWRRYGNAAGKIVATLAERPEWASIIFEGSDFTWAEAFHCAENEDVVRLADLLRRRSDLAATIGPASLLTQPALREMADALFGADGADMVASFAAQAITRNDQASAAPAGKP